jgi:hypothetical protein
MRNRENRQQRQVSLIFFFSSLSDIINANAISPRGSSKPQGITQKMIVVVQVLSKEILDTRTMVT